MRYMRFLFQIGAILLWAASASAGPTTITGKVTAKRGQTYHVQFEPSESVRPQVGDVVDFSLEIQGIKVKAGNGSVTRVEENSVWVDIAPTSKSKPRLNATGVIHATGQPPLKPVEYTFDMNLGKKPEDWGNLVIWYPNLGLRFKTSEKLSISNTVVYWLNLQNGAHFGRPKVIPAIHNESIAQVDEKTVSYDVDYHKKDRVQVIWRGKVVKGANLTYRVSQERYAYNGRGLPSQEFIITGKTPKVSSDGRTLAGRFWQFRFVIPGSINDQHGTEYWEKTILGILQSSTLLWRK